MKSTSGGELHQSRPSVEAEQREIKFFHEVHLIRGAILLLALGMGLAILNYASVILIPVTVALFLSYVLNPFVKWLMLLRIPGTQVFMPRTAAATVVVLLAVGSTVSLGVLIGNQLGTLGADLSRYEDHIADNVNQARQQIIALQGRFKHYFEPIRRSDTDELQPATSTGQSAPPAGASAASAESTAAASSASITRQLDGVLGRMTTYIAGGLSGLVGFLAQSLTCIFVLFFMLVEAPSIRGKLINVLGTTPSRREMLIEVFANVNRDVQRYLFAKFATNAVLAGVAMVAYWIYGLNYVLLLGLLAGLFNFVPYVGPVVGAMFPGVVAYLQFGHIESVVWVLAIYALLTGIEGNLVTPIVVGRHLKLNSLAVILALVFWGWIWGPLGMLMAIPILAAVKAVAIHLDDFRPLGELLKA